MRSSIRVATMVLYSLKMKIMGRLIEMIPRADEAAIILATQRQNGDCWRYKNIRLD
jgi:hypothetical protein